MKSKTPFSPLNLGLMLGLCLATAPRAEVTWNDILTDTLSPGVRYRFYLDPGKPYTLPVQSEGLEYDGSNRGQTKLDTLVLKGAEDAFELIPFQTFGDGAYSLDLPWQAKP